jgi:ribose 5-phosphate isomerase B
MFQGSVMRVVIGADHRGLVHKEFIKEHKAIAGHTLEWVDVGTFTNVRTDYPQFAKMVAETMQHKHIERGVLICGSGIGMAVVANRYAGIYAGVVWNEDVARFAGEHDNVNVLVLPADFVSKEKSVAIIAVWLSAKFLGGRYQERINQIDALGGLL